MKNWRIILRWSLLSLLLFGIGRYIVTHLDQFKVIRNINPSTIGLILLLQAFTQIIASFRYFTVIQSVGLKLPFSDWFRIFIYAMFLNRFYPQGGSIYRAAILKADYGFSISNYVTAFAAYSYLDRLFALVFTLLLVLLVEPGLTLASINIAFLLSLVIIAAISPILFLSRNQTTESATPGYVNKWRHKFSKILNELTICVHNPRALVTFALTGLLTFSITLTIGWLYFRGLGDPIGLARISVLNYIKTSLNTIPLTPGNIGATEAAYGLLSAGMNDSPANAIIVATINNICAVISVSITCSLALLILPEKQNQTSRDNIH